jgi:CHU_C Type IX secretion signal domain
MERNCRVKLLFFCFFSLFVLFGDCPLFAQTFQKIYNPTFGNNPIPLGLSQRPDGKYFMAFEASLSTNFVFLSCLNANGTPEWITQIDLTEPGNWILSNTYESVTATSDNGCLVAIAFFNPNAANTKQYQYLIKFSAAGSIEWSKKYEANKSCGDVYIMMTTVGDEIYNIIKECGTNEFHLTRLSNAGVILEEKISDEALFCQSLSPINTGGVLISALSQINNTWQSHVMKYVPNTGLQNLFSLSNYQITSAVMHTNGQVFFSATPNSNNSLSNDCVIGMAENGQVKWSKKVTFTESLHPTGCLFLSLNKSENQLLLAMANGQTNLMKFDLEGNLLDTKRYPDENECLTKLIATDDGAWAWLHSLQLVVSKADAALNIANCMPILPCKTKVESINLGTQTANWGMSPVNRYDNFSIQKNPLTLSSEDYCPNTFLPLDASFTVLDSVQCKGIPFEFRRNAINNDASVWHFEGGNPATLGGVFEIKSTFPDTGRHIITHLIGRGACSDTAHTSIFVVPAPEPLIITELQICEGDSVFLDLNIQDSTTLLQWSNGENFHSTWLKNEGSNPYIVENTEGCRTEGDIAVAFYPFHDFSILGEKTPCIGQKTEISLENIQNNQQVRWNTGSTESKTTIETDGLYKVAVTEGFCTKYDSIYVQFTHCDSCKIYAPTVFKIDTDVNGQFTLQSNCTIAAINLHILDRWGNLVFQTNQPDFKWEGYARGKPVAQGIFIYEAEITLEMNGKLEKIKKKGDILVLK